MIPYDDLVAALASWRARQGLPVAQPAGAPPPPPARTAAPASARTSSVQPPARTAPPGAPPRPTAPPSRMPSGGNDFDEDGDGALIEAEHYDTGGDEFAMPFGNAVEVSGESTAIGVAPEPPAEVLPNARRGKRNPDW